MKHSSRRIEAVVPAIVGAAAMVIAVPLALIMLGLLFALGLALACAVLVYANARRYFGGRRDGTRGRAVIEGEFRVVESKAE